MDTKYRHSYWALLLIFVIGLVLGVSADSVHAKETLLDVGITSIFLDAGDTSIVKARIQNIDSNLQTITLSIKTEDSKTGDGDVPSKATFLSSPQGTLNEDKTEATYKNILPGEHRNIKIEVEGSPLEGDTQVDITGTIEKCCTETRTMYIHVNEVYEFSGLEVAGIVFLALLAALVYWLRAGTFKKRHGK